MKQKTREAFTTEEIAETIIFIRDRNMMSSKELNEVLDDNYSNRKKKALKLVDEHYLKTNSKSPLL